MTETPVRYGSPPRQLNIRLPEQKRRRLKAKCAMDGLTIVEAVEKMVDEYLAGRLKIAHDTE